MLKTHTQRPAKLFLVSSYLLISAIPFLGLLLGARITHAPVLLSLELFFWLFLWSVFKRPFYFHWFLLPIFLALPTEIYLRIYFGQGISPHHLGLIFETSPKEAIEFLGSKTWTLFFITAGIVFWWYSLLIASRKIFIWSHWSRWIFLAGTSACMFITFYGEEFGYAPEKSAQVSSSDSDVDDDASPPASIQSRFEALTAPFRSIAPQLPTWSQTSIDKELISRTWPFGLVVQIGDFLYERHYLNVLTLKSSAFQFHASSDQAQKTIVIVIGESSRYDRWSLNGYNRSTNPLLMKQSNLVSFTDLISPVSATRLSVPIIMSRKPATQSLKAGFSEKSFISAFKEAGFKTFWISNQMSFGQFDTPISVFANEADVTQFLNLGGFTDQSSFDQIMFEPFQTAINDTAPYKLIVLHTLGNHWNYSSRHPVTFNHWLPSLTGVTDPDYNNRSIKEQMSNSYDNSILYTDWVLSQLVHQLNSQQKISAMMYVSDHGQVLYDGTCNLAFHGHNTQYDFHIPGFMWYSDAYLAAYPDKVEQLKLHQHARLSTENIFHTILDIANVHYPTEHLDRSIVDAQFQTHIRYVDSYGWSNYDDARMEGDCREVMDNHTPLKQDE